MRKARHTILLVEDSKTDVFLIHEALKCAGIDVEIQVVDDGHDATSYIDGIDSNESSLCPTLILLDMNLPRKNGDAVLQHLRNSSRCNACPVLIISSSDAPRDQAAVRHLGVAGYFRKPSDYAEYMKLGEIVKSLLPASSDRAS